MGEWYVFCFFVFFILWLLYVFLMMCFCVFLMFFCDFQHLLGPRFREFSIFSDTSFRVSFVFDFSLEFYQFFYDCFIWLCNDLTFLYSSTWHLCKHDFWRTLQRFCLIFTYSVCVEIWAKLQNTFLKTITNVLHFHLILGMKINEQMSEKTLIIWKTIDDNRMSKKKMFATCFSRFSVILKYSWGAMLCFFRYKGGAKWLLRFV